MYQWKESSQKMRKDEIVECIQEWMALPDSIEDLAKIYATIISETDKQLVYASEQIKNGIASKIMK